MLPLIFSESFHLFISERFPYEVPVTFPSEELYPPYVIFLGLGRGRRGRDRMVVRLTTTYAINVYHH